MRDTPGLIKSVAVIITLIVYGIQLVFLQLFIRLEPTMFGVNMPTSFVHAVDMTVQYLPALAFISTLLLALFAAYRSSAAVRIISVLFLAMMFVEEFVPIGPSGVLYGGVYWLVLSMAILAIPEVLLFVAAVERRSISIGAIAVSASLAASFFIWSYASRITFNLPPIGLVAASVYAFTIAFVVLAMGLVKRIGPALYSSLAASVAIMVPVTYFTASNVLAQKVVNMILQTSLGAPTPLPWFAPLFFLIFFIDIYSLIASVKARSFWPLSIAAGSTMIFTSVYLPYNVLYSYLAFSGCLMIYLNSEEASLQ